MQAVEGVAKAAPTSFQPAVVGRRAPFVRGPLLIAGTVALAAFFGLAFFARNSGPLPGDVGIEKFVQAIPWGPASQVFGWVTAFNGTTQATAGLILLAIAVLLRPRAFVFSVLASLSGTLYVLANSAVDRPRPTPELVRVTEHLGANSFPSGHAVFALTYATLIVLVVGGKYLSRRQLAVAAALGLAVVVFISLARLATGGHWPSDVYGGLLLSGGWLLVLLSVRPIGNPVLAWLGDPSGAWNALHPGLPNTLSSRRRLVERVFYMPIVQLFERFGFLVRGVLWAMVGVALIASAFSIGRQIDLYGSVAVLVQNPWGGGVAAAIVLALGGYALWGFVRTIFDPLRRGSNLGGLTARLGFLSSAASYTLILLFTIGLALSRAGSAQSGAFDPMPAVNLLESYGAVYVLGAIVFAIGVSQAIDGWREPFINDVLIEDAPHGLLFNIWTWLGRAGLWARAGLFGFVGVLIVAEHWSGHPWSTSFTHAFERIAQLPAGPAVAALLGAGLIALGLHSIGSARWMRLRPPVLGSRG